jgi:hypothetical protein
LVVVVVVVVVSSMLGFDATMRSAVSSAVRPGADVAFLHTELRFRMGIVGDRHLEPSRSRPRERRAGSTYLYLEQPLSVP